MSRHWFNFLTGKSGSAPEPLENNEKNYALPDKSLSQKCDKNKIVTKEKTIVKQPPQFRKLKHELIGSVDSGVGVWGESSKNIDGSQEILDEETGLKIIGLEEVANHDFREDGWMVVYDKVYDVTSFLGRHPGGEDVLLEYLGYDATMAFRGVGHSAAAYRMMEKYVIGILPKDERLNFTF